MKRSGSAVVMVMAALSTSDALGQATPGLPDQAQVPVAPLDPVTVTGTRTERSLYDVPGSASTVTKQTVDFRMPQRIDDLLRDLPGVEIGGGPRPGAGETNKHHKEKDRKMIKLQ